MRINGNREQVLKGYRQVRAQYLERRRNNAHNYQKRKSRDIIEDPLLRLSIPHIKASRQRKGKGLRKSKSKVNKSVAALKNENQRLRCLLRKMEARSTEDYADVSVGNSNPNGESTSKLQNKKLNQDHFSLELFDESLGGESNRFESDNYHVFEGEVEETNEKDSYEDGNYKDGSDGDRESDIGNEKSEVRDVYSDYGDGESDVEF